jgi:hypothetical protein
MDSQLVQQMESPTGESTEIQLDGWLVIQLAAWLDAMMAVPRGLLSDVSTELQKGK